MLFSIYLLTTLLTNITGLAITSNVNHILDGYIENKGYIKKEKSDKDLIKNLGKKVLLFFVPGYFLIQSFKVIGHKSLDEIVEEKKSKGEIILTNDEKGNIYNNVIKETKTDSIKVNRSMYTDIRYPNTDDVDMDFWEEEEKDLNPYLITENTEPVKKEPIQEYLDSFTDQELIDMANQIEKIRRLKRDREELLNNKEA